METMQDAATRITKRCMEEQSIKITHYINSKIRPKPRFIPNFIWKLIVKRVITIDFYTK